jgi:hypothetical protein
MKLPNKPMKLAIALPRLRLGRALAAYRQIVGPTSRPRLRSHRSPVLMRVPLGADMC